MKNISGKALICEFLGTFFLIFMGCGSIILSETTVPEFASTIPYFFGGAVCLFIFLFGTISGAHFNPAVTFGFYITGESDFIQLLTYWGAQVIGAITASLCHFLILGSQHSFGTTQMNLPLIDGFAAEFFMTAFLMLTILLVKEKKWAGIPIGLSIVICILLGGAHTGTSLNPARWLAPALFSQQFEFFWLYTSSALAGALMTAFVYTLLQRTPESSLT